MDAVRCDGCGDTQPIPGVAGWVEMVPFGIDVRLVGDKGRLHACSTRCAGLALQRESWIPDTREGDTE